MLKIRYTYLGTISENKLPFSLVHCSQMRMSVSDNLMSASAMLSVSTCQAATRVIAQTATGFFLMGDDAKVTFVS